MAENEKRNDPDVDGGHAWAILAGCFFMYMFIAGTIKSYGVLYTEMITYYDAGAGNTAWIGSLNLLLLFGMGPFSNWLSVKYSFRTISFIGGVLVGVGHVASAFVPKMEYMYLTFGLIGGLGYGLSFSPCSTIISYYFEKNRALANGITLSASGIGSFCFPFLYQFLFEVFTLRGVLWIVGAIVLNICAAALIFVQPKVLLKRKIIEMKQTETNMRNGQDEKGLLNVDTTLQDKSITSKNKNENCKGFNLNFKLFKNPRFTMYTLAFTLCMNSYGNNMILIPSQVRALGYDKPKIVLSVSIMGGCEVIARVLLGWIVDKNLIKRKHIFLISMVIPAVFAFIAPMFDSFIFMAIYAAIIGIFPGSFLSIMQVVVIDVVGMADFPSAYGLMNLCLAVGSVFSQPVIGWLSDATGNWHASFYLTGSLLLSSGVIMLFEPLIIRYCMEPVPVEKKPEGMQLVVSLRRQSPPRPSSNDTVSLLDDENDVSFTSRRISKVYKPTEDKNNESPKSTSAPLANSTEM